MFVEVRPVRNEGAYSLVPAKLYAMRYYYVS